MEQLRDRLESASNALGSLAEALRMPLSVIVRDASIQRFEYTFESVWKLLKTYLGIQEGIACNSPKQCFREALKAGLLSIEETEVCLTMTDDRNLTADTYIEAVAVAIHRKLPEYHAVMYGLVAAVRTSAEST